MPIFLRWGWAVIRHWFLLIGGTVVSVGLLIWDQYVPPDTSRLPSMVWWTGIAAGFVGACFLAWQEEWTTATALAIKRPEFAHSYAGLEQLRKTDGSLIERFDIRFLFTNGSGIPVDELTSRVVVIANFDDAPVGDSGYRTNGNRVFGPMNLRTEVAILPFMPAHYFAIDLAYKDSRTGAQYWQQMFYKWPGSRATDFDMGFRDCTLEERRLVETYTATRLKPSMSRTVPPSPSQGA